MHFKSLKGLNKLDLNNNTILKMSNVNLEHLEKLGCSNVIWIDFSKNIISKVHVHTFEDLF